MTKTHNPCEECAHYHPGQVGGLQVGVRTCRGDPLGRKHGPDYARRMDKLCGPGGKWWAPIRSADRAG